MNGTIEAPAKPKRVLKTYTPAQRAEVLQRLAKGETQTSIGNALGIPQTTVGEWAIAAGLNRTKRKSLANRVQARLSEQVERITDTAARQVQDLLAKSLLFGNGVLDRANEFVPSVGPDGLVQVANAGKIAIQLSRQSLGLNDQTESVIVRVDLVGQAQSEKPVIELDPKP